MRFTSKLVLRGFLCLACLLIASAFAMPAHAATATKNQKAAATPFVFDGGCKSSSDGDITACISVYANYVFADAYISGTCLSTVDEGIYDVTTATWLPWSHLGADACGRFTIATPRNGHTFMAYVHAYSSNYNVAEWSPYLVS
jgi:hypothetical protein